MEDSQRPECHKDDQDSGREIGGKEKQEDVCTTKTGKTGHSTVVRHSLLWVSCATTLDHGEFLAKASAKDTVWVHGSAAMCFCVYFCGPCYHQMACKHLWSEVCSLRLYWCPRAGQSFSLASLVTIIWKCCCVPCQYSAGDVVLVSCGWKSQ